MNISVRTATTKDLKAIQELNLLLFKKEHNDYDKLLNLKWTFSKGGTKYFKDKISKKTECAFVAVSGNKIVGYLAGGITTAESYRNLPLLAELENTLVLEEYRSQGIGTLLYNKFIEWCKTKKVKLIRVQASAQNAQAIGFYRKNGFKDNTLILESKL